MPDIGRDNPGKVLDTGIEPVKLGQIIDKLVLVKGQDFFEPRFQINKVNQISMDVQPWSRDLHLNAVLMGMGKILRAPITPGKEVPGNKLTLNGKAVHGSSSPVKEWPGPIDYLPAFP
jgi:hypothetical protein